MRRRCGSPATSRVRTRAPGARLPGSWSGFERHGGEDEPRAKPARVLAFSNFATTLGAGSLFDRVVSELGAVNVAAEHGIGARGTIANEHVAAWNPDWIVAGVEPELAASTRRRLLADPGVAVTTAGRQNQILLLDNRTFLARSHHAVRLMEAIAEALYPGPT